MNFNDALEWLPPVTNRYFFGMLAFAFVGSMFAYVALRVNDYRTGWTANTKARIIVLVILSCYILSGIIGA